MPLNEQNICCGILRGESQIISGNLLIILCIFMHLYAFGGGGEIRTHGRVTPTAVFKTAALNRSATPPLKQLIERIIPFRALVG